MLRRLSFLLLIGLWGGAPQAASPHSDLEVREREERQVDGRFLLQDHFGNAVTDEAFRGHYLLIAFGYTHCPDICPTTLAEMRRVMELLGERGERVQPMFVTVDPERDTPAHLREYVTWFHPRLIGLTGSRELVERAAFNFNVRFRKVVEPGAPPDHYAMDHSAGIYLMGPGGRFLKKFSYGTPPEEIAETLASHLEPSVPLID